jgi:hypothetical protein
VEHVGASERKINRTNSTKKNLCKKQWSDDLLQDVLQLNESVATLQLLYQPTDWNSLLDFEEKLTTQTMVIGFQWGSKLCYRT